MDKKTALDIAKQYAAVVSRRFPVKKILLYGSYTRGNYHEHSDIDIAVVVDKIEDDFLGEFTELFKLRRNINSRIEPVLLEAAGDGSGFLKNIMEYGETILPSA